MTGLLVVLGTAGELDLAANIGLVQGAALATFFVFSANSRNIILASDGLQTFHSIYSFRLMLVVPLGVAAYVLSVVIGGVAWPIASVLLVRKVAEWIAEINLAQHERLNHYAHAQCSVVVEVSAFLLCVALTLGLNVDFYLSALLWAVAPVVATVGIRFCFSPKIPGSIFFVLPHVGSTAIIGVCVYVFRMSIALLTDKTTAGILFTAFAIGGVVPTTLGQALAPTILRKQKVSGLEPIWLWGLGFLLAGMVVIGGYIAFFTPEAFISIDKPAFFWLASGLSMAGGALMTVAIFMRAKLIQAHLSGEVFGTDLMANILITISVPLIFFAFGPKSIAFLYLASALMNVAFLTGAFLKFGSKGMYKTECLTLICLLMLVPLFVQLSGGVFQNPSTNFDAKGQFQQLPIPISVFALFLSVAILGNYAAARRSLTVVFFTMVLFVSTTLLLWDGNSVEGSGKLILMAQFLFPIFGLILGEMYGAATKLPVFERTAFIVITFVTAAQLVTSWMSGSLSLTPQVIAFSIYQYEQFFPAIVLALLMALAPTIWCGRRFEKICLVISVCLTVLHATAAASLTTFVAAVLWLALSAKFALNKVRFRQVFLPLASILIVVVGFYIQIQTRPNPNVTPDTSSLALADSVKGDTISVPERPLWLIAGVSNEARLDQWRSYADEITSSPEVFLLGHSKLPDRSVHPSAYNYWLDVIYSYGLVAIFPLAIFLVRLFHMAWRTRAKILSSSAVVGPLAACAYLIFCESFFNVGLRKPYVGIISFFLIGLLATRLRTLSKTSDVSE